MWIQTTRNKLRLYERYTDIDGNEHRISVPLRSESPRDYKEAVSKLMLKMAEQERSGDEIRLNDLMTRYLKRDDLKPSTTHTYQYLFEKIQDIFGNHQKSRFFAPHLPSLPRICHAWHKKKSPDCYSQGSDF